MEHRNTMLLWRVDLVHRNGYHAPSQVLEGKKNEIHKKVRDLELRLMDFPKTWSYSLTVISRDFDSSKGKWIIRD